MAANRKITDYMKPIPDRSNLETSKLKNVPETAKPNTFNNTSTSKSKVRICGERKLTEAENSMGKSLNLPRGASKGGLVIGQVQLDDAS